MDWNQGLHGLARPLFEQMDRQTRTHDRIAALVERYQSLPRGGADLTTCEFRVFSPNGEDGILCELLARVGAEDRHFIETGVGSGIEGSCIFLAEVLGWKGLWIEPSEGYWTLRARWRGREGISTQQSRLSPEQFNHILTEHRIPAEPDVVSIRANGNEYYLWDAMDRRPRIVAIAYNGCLDTRSGTRLVTPYREEGWDGATDYFGASLGALEALAAAKNYQLVYTDLTGSTAFFLRQDLHTDGYLVPRRSANYFFSGRGWPRDPEQRPYITV